ncbi:MAG: hypothetical protein H7Z74_12315 [Anaerolineae bacterium]|nr:hypothetical protein [Gemmatimonadaceae bacterium]
MRLGAIPGAIVALLAAGPLFAQHGLIAIPLSDPVYVQIDGLLRQGCRAAMISPFRPYLASQIRDAVGHAERDSSCAGTIRDALGKRFAQVASDSIAAESLRSRLSFGAAATLRATARRDLEYRPLWRDIRPDSVGDRVAVGIVRGRVTWNGGDRLVAVADAYAQSSRRNDPQVRGRGFRQSEAVVDFGDSYVNGSIGPLTVSLGRSGESWLAEANESLVLSAQGPPLDRLSASARWRRFEARALFSSVNDVVLDARDSLTVGIPPQRVHRFLAAHALTFRPSPSWEFTLGETALLTRRGAGVDLAFVNPVMLYVVSENDTSRAGAAADGNNLTAFGSVRAVRGRATAAAELVVDDIQIDGKDRENIPDQLAWRLAASIGLPLFVPASVGVEYKRVGSFTYLRRSYAEVYQQYDSPLGSELGPDADLFRAFGEVWGNGRLRFGGRVGRWRRGARRIDMRPAEGAFGHAGEPFPSLTVSRASVQSAWLGDVSAEFLDRILPVTIRAEVARVDNVNNQPAQSATYFRASLVGTYQFRYP